ncbi:MAG: phosphotransferase [Anaerolineae bacterium]
MHVTTEWLTNVLRQSGKLRGERVIKIEQDCSTPFGATVCRLTVTYSAAVELPNKFFLKLGDAASAIYPHTKREVLFYEEVQISGEDLPVPRCYATGYDDDAQTTYILLEDLADTHETLEHEIPPTERHCYQIMETLAQLHAHWWEKPDAYGRLAPSPTPETITCAFQDDVAAYHAFADYLGDRLLPSRRAIYEQVIVDYLPLKLERFSEQRHITLTHGDAHAWNFMYPKAVGDIPRLLDWEALGTYIGPLDVAYLMAIFWHPARRAWLEKPLVAHYHDELIQRGIKGYTLGDCQRDYRLAVIELLFMPVWWWKHDTPAFLWWHRLERLMMAYEDLACADLLP